MPITKLQSDILRLIAANRDPESFVAGGVPINRAGPQVSADIEIPSAWPFMIVIKRL